MCSGNFDLKCAGFKKLDGATVDRALLGAFMANKF
jgi:hypothetical protein